MPTNDEELAEVLPTVPEEHTYTYWDPGDDSDVTGDPRGTYVTIRLQYPDATNFMQVARDLALRLNLNTQQRVLLLDYGMEGLDDDTAGLAEGGGQDHD